jgi:hypothetical protein
MAMTKIDIVQNVSDKLGISRNLMCARNIHEIYILA